MPRKTEADRFGKRTTLPSGCIKNLTRSPDFNPRCSLIAFGIVAWPFVVIADSKRLFHYIPANVILTSLITCQAQDRTAACDAPAAVAFRAGASAAISGCRPGICCTSVAALASFTSPLSRKLTSQIRSKCAHLSFCVTNRRFRATSTPTQNRDPILAKARRRSLFTGIIGHTA